MLRCGIDLVEVAREAGLTPERVAELHAGAEYRVAFLGFTAGFPYLSGLPEALAVPRLPSPRRLVPAGSVAIAVHVAPASTLFRPRAYRMLALFGSSESVVLSALASIWVHVVPASTLLNKPEDGVKRGKSPVANTVPSTATATSVTLRPGGPLSDV